MLALAVETLLFDDSAIEKIRDIAGDQGPAFVSEMAQLFLEETGKSIEDLRAASTRADWKSVARVSHSLKSSAATLGLMRLAAACRALEMEIRNTTGSEETPTLTAAVFDRFEESVPILRRLL